MFIKCFFILLGTVAIYSRSGLEAPWVMFLSDCTGGAVTVLTALKLSGVTSVEGISSDLDLCILKHHRLKDVRITDMFVWLIPLIMS